MKHLLFGGLFAVAMALTSCQKNEVNATDANENMPLEETATQFDLPDYMAAPIDPEKVVARVGTNEIKQAAVNKIVDIQAAQYGDQVPAEFKAQLRAQLQGRAVEALITQTLLREETTKRAITVDEDAITKRLDKMTANLPEGVTLDDALRQYGFSKDEFTKNVVEGLKFEKMLDADMADTYVAPTENDVKEFYKRTKTKPLAPPNRYAPATS